MEGLYHNNIYPSSSYMMQHPDHNSYSPPTLPYRTNSNTSSAFSDARPDFASAPSSSSPHYCESTSTTTPHSAAVTSVPTTSMVGWSSPGGYSWPNPVSSTYPPPHPHSHPHSATGPASRHSPYSSSTSCYSLSTHTPIQRPKLTTTVWEDEGTVCYQVDAKSVCVARRQDNDMINGTKLLNVVGMSRGKRDGILKNEKGRIVVKVGAMHLKGVWITFERAKDLASKFKITDLLYPLFTDDPSVFLCPSTVSGANDSVPPSSMLPSATSSHSNMPMMMPPSTRSMNPSSFQYKQESAYGFSMSTWDRSCHTDSNNESFTSILRGNDQPDLPSGSCSPVPGTIAPMIAPASEENDIYLMNNPYHYPASSRPSIGLHQPPSSSHHHQPPPPRLANVPSASNYDEYDYDSFSRKPMIKPPSHATYPHSPPHEDSSKYKPNPLSHTTVTGSPSHWSASPSLTSQLSESAKSTLSGRPASTPLYSTSNSTKDDLIAPSQCIGRKRSLQSSSASIASPPPSASSILPPPPSLVDDTRNIKRLRTLNN